jgi:nucleoid-associated protein YgaU
VRVRPGDSLWLITAHRLGPAADPTTIAATWPRWYAANRAVIGPDPNLILPGQELTSPDGPPVDGARR